MQRDHFIVLSGTGTAVIRYDWSDLLNYTETELRGLSPLANYTDRGTAACRRSWWQILQVEGATWLA
jgi:hypothetical protein